MSKTQGKVIIYQKPTCTTCRKTVKLVTASRAEFATIDYYKEPFTKALMKGWRRGLVGDTLLGILHGRNVVRLDPKSHRLLVSGDEARRPAVK